jgi:hypothetical protein
MMALIYPERFRPDALVRIDPAAMLSITQVAVVTTFRLWKTRRSPARSMQPWRLIRRSARARSDGCGSDRIRNEAQLLSRGCR